MKHAVIVAHPNRRSFNVAVANAYISAVRGFGDEAIMRDLYRLDFDPRLGADELPWAKNFAPRADVAAERTLLADVDVFVLVYPLWFNAPPAMLKGYVDRVFGMGFGYGSPDGGSDPRLRGRILVSFTSSGAPEHWVEQTGALERLRRGFDDHLAEICGLSVIEHRHFGGIVPGIRPDAVRAMLSDVEAVTRRHFAPITAGVA
jgi:NAD(P)H dehydrogenase (quinone)